MGGYVTERCPYCAQPMFAPHHDVRAVVTPQSGGYLAWGERVGVFYIRKSELDGAVPYAGARYLLVTCCSARPESARALRERLGFKQLPKEYENQVLAENTEDLFGPAASYQPREVRHEDGQMVVWRRVLEAEEESK